MSLQALKVVCLVVLEVCLTWVELLVAQAEKAQRLRKSTKISMFVKIITSDSPLLSLPHILPFA